MPKTPLALLACFVALTSASASAAPCDGFAGVEDTDPFCASIAWTKNRGVTRGCADGSIYCPESVVTRRQMAAFLSRLQAVLPPTIVAGNGTALGVHATGHPADNWLLYRSGGKLYAVHLLSAFRIDGSLEISLDEGTLAFEGVNCTGTAYLYRRNVVFPYEHAELVPTVGGHRLYAPDRSRGSMYRVKSAYLETPQCVPWDTDVEGFPAVLVEDLGTKFAPPLTVE